MLLRTDTCHIGIGCVFRLLNTYVLVIRAIRSRLPEVRTPDDRLIGGGDWSGAGSRSGRIVR